MDGDKTPFALAALILLWLAGALAARPTQEGERRCDWCTPPHGTSEVAGPTADTCDLCPPDAPAPRTRSLQGHVHPR